MGHTCMRFASPVQANGNWVVRAFDLAVPDERRGEFGSLSFLTNFQLPSVTVHDHF